MLSKTNRLSTLKGIIDEFMVHRITSAIEKRLRRNSEYKGLQQRQCDLEKQVLGFLSDEQKAVFHELGEVNTEMLCVREEFVYRRGMIDAYRIKDIILCTFD